MIVLLLGTQRGGTTIVGRFAGLLPQAAYVGEAHRMWEFGVGPDRSCGCGVALRSCPVWSAVFTHMESCGIDPAAVSAWQRTAIPPSRAGRALARLRPSGRAARRNYRAASAAMYEGLAAAYGSTLLVDGSKSPALAAVLDRRAGDGLRVLHVVRDARGVVASQLRRRTDGATPWAAVALAASWLARHVDASVAARPADSLRLRYEDVVAEPVEAIERVARWTGLDPSPELRSAATNRKLVLPLVHTPRGPNPAAEVTLTEDQGWRSALGPGRRLAVTAVALPGLLWYRYPPSARRSDTRAPT